MSFAYMPFYTGDYLRDTRHLSPMRHGIYVLLLCHCWDQKGPLPLDEQECAGIANCRSQEEMESLRYVLARYFVRTEDGFYNVRMQREIGRSEALSKKRSSAGRLGNEKKFRQLLGKSRASATHEPLSPSPSPTPSQGKTPSPPSQGTVSISLKEGAAS